MEWNIIQSLLFGLLHGIAFVAMTGVLTAAAITLMTGAVAFAMGLCSCTSWHLRFS
jgi:hypothetical protein